LIHEWQTSISFFFGREVNGIPFDSNGIHVSFNLITGKVTSYSLDWWNNVQFPAVGNVLSAREVLGIAAAQIDFDVVYMNLGGNELKLVYTFDQFFWSLDPYSGNPLDWNGEVSEFLRWGRPDYSDVIGHWSEGYVTALADNGIHVFDGAFNPDQVITQEEFARFVSSVMGGGHNIWVYDAFVASGIMPRRPGTDPSEVQFSDVSLLRQEAAKIIAVFMGYGRLLEVPEIFAFPFNDDVDPGYIGGITICAALGLLYGDADGNFNAADTMTRAEAAAVVYRLVNYNSNN
jgi:hypothetical protein